jgi:hypothetical protein
MHEHVDQNVIRTAAGFRLYDDLQVLTLKSRHLTPAQAGECREEDHDTEAAWHRRREAEDLLDCQYRALLRDLRIRAA